MDRLKIQIPITQLVASLIILTIKFSLSYYFCLKQLKKLSTYTIFDSLIELETGSC